MWFFYCFNFERNYDVFKSKNPCILLNKNIKSNKNKQELKMENPHTVLERLTLCFSWYKNRQLKKTVMKWSPQKKREGIFYTVYFVQRKIFLNLCLLSLYVKCIEYTFRIYILLLIKKHYFIHFCSLFLKSPKAFSVSLK